jgi:drug/metabolite transporter (DMT)-like permease
MIPVSNPAHSHMSPLRLSLFTVLALLAFAGNSLLCRGALAAGAIDPGPFTLVRLASGAAMLAVLQGLRWRHGTGDRRVLGAGADNNGLTRILAIQDLTASGPIALALYAVAFSWAYLRIPAGVGALVLFGSTQATMIGWAFRRGERPRPLELVGIVIALVGLAGLAAPGRTAPDPVGVGLMAVAGVGWGVYSLLGKGARDPLAANTAAFTWSTVLAAALLAFPALGRSFSPRGILLASLSGALASALGYSLWYSALPHLSRTRAAALQLTVPVIAALAGIALLNEPATLRLAVSGAVILGGVGLSVVTHHPDRVPTSSHPVRTE